MLFGDDRRLRNVERIVLATAKAVEALAKKADLNIEIGLADLQLEYENMTTLAEINAQADAILVKAEAQDDLTLAISGQFNDLKTLLASVQAELAALIAAGSPTAAELSAVADKLVAINAAIDADALAKAAITGTVADPSNT